MNLCSLYKCCSKREHFVVCVMRQIKILGMLAIFFCKQCIIAVLGFRSTKGSFSNLLKYLNDQIDPDDKLHLEFGVDLVIEVVICDFVNVFDFGITDTVHQRNHVRVKELEHQIWCVVKDGHAAHVERYPLVLKKISANEESEIL